MANINKDLPCEIGEVLFSSRDLEQTVSRLGEEISLFYKDAVTRQKPLVILGVLSGAFIFLADLVRKIELPAEIYFVKASSYNNGTSSCGTVSVTIDSSTRALKGSHVLIVEDIADTGLTLLNMTECIKRAGAKSIKVCALLSKTEKRSEDIKIDFYGAEIPDRFVVGYGLDFAQKYRNLPYIAALNTEMYK